MSARVLIGICGALVAFAALMANPTRADNYGPIAEIGANLSTYTETSTEMSYVLRAGYDSFYAFGGKEKAKIKMLGQPLGEAKLTTFGLGLQRDWGPLTTYVEAGYAFNDTSINPEIRQEVVYTHLVHHHHKPGRPIPVQANGRKGYKSSYEADDGYVARVGVKWEFWQHFSVNASYKWLVVDEELAIWDEENRAKGLGYWREDNVRDFSAFEVGLSAHW